MKRDIETYTVVKNRHGDEFLVEFCFPPEFKGFQGHFDENPVLPGVCLVESVLVAAEKATGCSLRMEEIVMAKFLAFSGPGETLSVSGSVREHVVRAEVHSCETRVAHIRLKVKDE